MRFPAEIDICSLRLGDTIGRGGVGEVLPVTGTGGGVEYDRPLVAKRYKASVPLDGRALRRFVGWRRSLPVPARMRLDRLTAWPLAVLVDGEAVHGYLMNRVPDGYMQSLRLPSGARKSVVREAQYLLADDPRARRLAVSPPDIAARALIVASLADAVSFLHREGVAVGDLSARNVLWTATPPDILLVDCDSFALQAAGSPVPVSQTVDWDDPASTRHGGPDSDVYKLGLFALRTFARRYQTRSADDMAGSADPILRLLVRQSLAADPGERPPVEAWERWAAGVRARAAGRPA